MARPPKRGLDYFPFDVNFFDNAVIVTLSGKFGVKGESVVMRLLCAIFNNNGYYALWDDPLRYKLRRDVPGTSPEYLDRLVEFLASSGFFDEGCFRQAQCLTSVDIQERYFKAVERRKKTNGDYPYLLINVCRNLSSADIDADINPQSKLKENSKEKEEKYVMEILRENGCADPEAEYDRLVQWNDGRHIKEGGWAAMDEAARAQAARLWRPRKTAKANGAMARLEATPDSAAVEEECAYWREYGTTTPGFARRNAATRDAVSGRIRDMMRSGVKSNGRYLKQIYTRSMGAEEFHKKYWFVDMSDLGGGGR